MFARTERLADVTPLCCLAGADIDERRKHACPSMGEMKGSAGSVRQRRMTQTMAAAIPLIILLPTLSQRSLPTVVVRNFNKFTI